MSDDAFKRSSKVVVKVLKVNVPQTSVKVTLFSSCFTASKLRDLNI